MKAGSDAVGFKTMPVQHVAPGGSQGAAGPLGKRIVHSDTLAGCRSAVMLATRSALFGLVNHSSPE